MSVENFALHKANPYKLYSSPHLTHLSARVITPRCYSGAQVRPTSRPRCFTTFSLCQAMRQAVLLQRQSGRLGLQSLTARWPMATQQAGFCASRLKGSPPSNWGPRAVSDPDKEAFEKVLQLGDEAHIPQSSFKGLLQSLQDIKRSAAANVGSTDPATMFLWSIPVGLGLAMLQGATPSQFWAFYVRMLEHHPFTTKIATGVTGAFLGDVLAQLVPVVVARYQQQPDQGPGTPPPSQQPWRFDIVRSGRFMLYSMLLGTPVVHFWYTFLDAVVVPSAPTAMSTVAAKVALDQLLMTPIMTCLFFTTMATMEGKADQAMTLLKTKLVPTLKANYMLWPAAHCINFSLIPPDQRILYVNCVALIWTMFLSSMAAGTAPASGGVKAVAAEAATTDPLEHLHPEPIMVPIKRKVE